jgi:putative GTP pyrophosphokinase
MNANEIDAIVNEYEQRLPLYEEFGRVIHDFLGRALKTLGVDDVLIKDRPKSVKSFREKLLRPGKAYRSPLTELTDLTGVRVIVCYVDQIPIVEQLLESEFDIDLDHSVDKAVALKPNVFGYLSVHYIVSPNLYKAPSHPWNRFGGLKAEVQIRTSLQDSWATVSHALQYKKETDVPDGLKRKLFRLAGLFELADEQFRVIRDESLQRQRDVQQQLAEGDTRRITIDFLSISQFLAQSTMMQEAINIASIHGLVGDQTLLEHYSRADASVVTEECARLGLDTIEAVEHALKVTARGNDQYLANVSSGRAWKATKAFVLLLLIVKAYPQAYDVNYFVERYGWDYGVAQSILDEATRIHAQYGYALLHQVTGPPHAAVGARII